MSAWIAVHDWGGGLFLLPRDRGIRRCFRSWSDSSEPVTSRSAAPGTRGQQWHFLPLRGKRYDWKCVIWKLSRVQGSVLTRTVCCCDASNSPWAAGASLTAPSGSMVSRGELKFFLKAPAWCIGWDTGRKCDCYLRRQRDKNSYCTSNTIPLWLCSGTAGLHETWAIKNVSRSKRAKGSLCEGKLQERKYLNLNWIIMLFSKTLLYRIKHLSDWLIILLQWSCLINLFRTTISITSVGYTRTSFTIKA